MVFLEEASQTILDWVEMSFIHSVQVEDVHQSILRLTTEQYTQIGVCSPVQQSNIMSLASFDADISSGSISARQVGQFCAVVYHTRAKDEPWMILRTVAFGKLTSSSPLPLPVMLRYVWDE